jgi:6-pyruvoyl-tetrahydropterin synthase
MYTVAVTRDFIANHYLVGGDWGRENDTHAHHYVLELSLESATLDKHGYLVDIVAIEAALDEVVEYFRDTLLNDKPEFAGLNPSLEHFSRILCYQLLERIAPPGSGHIQVKLWENDTCWAAYRRPYSQIT